MSTVHRHRPNETHDYLFSHCQRPTVCRPAAHGNITRVDTCRCGVTRQTNINLRAVERGKWQPAA